MHRNYPTTRMRRMRRNNFSRRLMREHTLNVSDLIYPMFVMEGKNRSEAIHSMPGSLRLTPDLLLKEAQTVHQLNISAIAIFPVIAADKKSACAAEAYNSDGLIPSIVRLLKRELPELGVITDVALDPYTTHGQDGIVDNDGYVLNDETVAILCRQALTHAEAGADIVAPSDMMDGRIGAIRQALEAQRFHNTRILAYTAKYASNFYAPFRDAVRSSAALGDTGKDNYQMDYANSREALAEAELDIKEGADIIMVKPATPYLDVIHQIHRRFDIPVFAYHVSGEYAMLKAAVQKNLLAEKPCVLETLSGIKRAGASAIMTYYALATAEWLKDDA